MSRFSELFQMSKLATIAGLLVFLSSCSKDDSNQNGKVDFDRDAMLEYWIDQNIVPAYQNFDQQLTHLQFTWASLTQAQFDPVELEALRNSFKGCYLAFQQIKAFEIGPAADISLRAQLNTYPADTALIRQNIASGGANLQSASNLTAKGLPALDYLLFSTSASAELMGKASQSQYYRNYVDAVLSDMANQWQTIYTAWINPGNYKSTFRGSTGNSAGSALSQMVNALNKDYELIKNAKIGFPAGKKTLGKTYPFACEGYFSQMSEELIIANLEATHNLYRGISFDGTRQGPGLMAYTEALGATTYNGEPLYEAIDQQFSLALEAVEKIPAPLSLAVDQYKNEVDAAYLEIQKNVILLKTDMPSAMGVLITYQDNDGD